MPRLQRRFGTVPTLLGSLLAMTLRRRRGGAACGRRTRDQASHLIGIDVEETELDEISDHAESITVGSES